MKTMDKINLLRVAMKEQDLDAYIIPSSDPHQSEYVSPYWKSRQWISGFSGSAGTVVVTVEHAGVWTDSRYFIQAEEELKDGPIELHKLIIPHTSEHLDWLLQNVKHGGKVGMDGRVFSVGSIRNMATKFQKKNVDVLDVDLISGIWKNRPSLPAEALIDHPVSFSGKSRAEKIELVREKMDGADYYLISTLDDIAWLFNLRGRDVPCNPVFYSFAVVGKDATYLFLDLTKVPSGLKQQLNEVGIIIKPYEDITAFLKSLESNKKILLDLGSINNQLYNAVPKECIIEGQNLVTPLKAIKNPVEISQIRNAMLKDGVALTKLYIWLEKKLQQYPVPEAAVAKKLADFRMKQGEYFGESFDAIVGYAGNGAIVHYKPEPDNCALILREGILLFDSGGQYIDGTTDITRTIALSQPTQEQKMDYTLVLKGHIALSSAVFPSGTTGVQLDTLARMYLWNSLSNYGHGTGHGVGFFNNVHEAPQGFTPAVNTPRANTILEPGMLTSNEPGLYRPGKYGIRIENLILCIEAGESEFGKFYKFETLSLFPIDTTLIERALLSIEEVEWLNKYHNEVYQKLAPLLDNAESNWLSQKCQRI